MKSYDKWQTEDRRLATLLLLKESEGYRLNEYLLQQLLDVRGHMVSQDRVRSDLDWLREQSLVKVDTIAELRIATILQRGLDAANGRIEVSGVKRPAPEG